VTLDPAYAFEYDRLADLCRVFLSAHEKGDELGMPLATGQITAQCAAIYKLSPPAGVLDVAALFRREDTE
jgi:hypothetical protein